MSFCTQCGTKCSDGSKFCPSCGAPLAQAVAAQSTPVESPVPVEVDTPVEPVASGEPVVPVEPIAPEEAAEPAEPVVPVAPVAPEAPLNFGTVSNDVPPVVPPVPPVPPAAPNAAFPAAGEEPKAPKSKKTGLWVMLTCGVVLIGLVVALLVMFLGGGKSKLAKAFDKTMGAFDEVFSDTGLSQMAKNLETIEKQQAMSVDFSVNVDSYGEAFNVRAVVDEDVAAKAASGYVQAATEGGYFEAKFSLDDDVIMLSAPQFFDDVLSVDLLNLGADASKGNFADMLGVEIPKDTSLDLFADAKSSKGADLAAELEAACGKQWKAAIKSVKLTDEQKDKDGSVYTVTADPDAVYDLLESYIDFLQNNEAYLELVEQYNIDMGFNGISASEMEEALGEIKDEIDNFPATIQVRISKSGYLTGIYVEAEGVTVSFELTGEDNPWESYVLKTSDGTTLLEGGITQSKDKIVWSNQINDYWGDPETELRFIMDKDGRFTLEVEDLYYEETEEILTGTIAPKDGGMLVELNIDDDGDAIEISMELLPLQYQPTQLSDDPVNLFLMDEDDINNMVMEIAQNVMANPELAEIFG